MGFNRKSSDGVENKVAEDWQLVCAKPLRQSKAKHGMIRCMRLPLKTISIRTRFNLIYLSLVGRGRPISRSAAVLGLPSERVGVSWF
jgi:hypothetical protein